MLLQKTAPFMDRLPSDAFLSLLYRLLSQSLTWTVCADSAKTSRAEKPTESSAKETLKRAAELFDSSVLSTRMPQVRSSSGSREQQQTHKAERRTGRPLAEGANLFDAVAAFAASQDPMLAGKTTKSSAGNKAAAAGQHKNPFIGVQKLVMPQGQKSQAPLSARSLKQESDQISSRRSVRAEKLASKKPQAQKTVSEQPVNPPLAANNRFLHKGRAAWSSADSGRSTEWAGTNPRSVKQPSDSQQDQQQNAFQVPRQPPWTKYRGSADLATASTSADRLRQDSAGQYVAIISCFCKWEDC